MATSKSILDALANVGDEMCEARAIAETFVALNGDDINAPSWPFLLLRMVDRIGKATEDLETLVRQRALPVLRDMESVTDR